MQATHQARRYMYLLVLTVFALLLTSCNSAMTSVKNALNLSQDPTPSANAQSSSSTGTNLGVFSLLNEGTATGNSLTVLYGKSTEGDQLTTYWYAQPDVMEVVSLGNSQYEIMETLGNRCMTANGADVTINTCSASSNQLFTLNLQSDGSYVIKSGNNTCINAANSFTIVNAVACNTSSPQQRWKFSGATKLDLGSGSSTSTGTGGTTPTPPSGGTGSTSDLGVFSLLNEGTTTGNSLTVLYGKSTEGDQLTTYWYAQPDVMEVVSLGSSQYEIMETLGNRCITANGSAVTINTCTKSANQIFTLNLQSDGSYVIKSGSNTCINAPNSFAIVNAVACNTSSPQQRWMFSGATKLNLGTSGSTGTTTPPPSNPTTGTGTGTGTSGSGGTTSTSGLGVFSLLNEATTQGNSLTILYGKSTEGDQLTTYWYAQPDVMEVLSLGNSQYEIIEILGNRCVTASGSTVTITTCKANTNQIFSLKPQSDGSYVLQSATGTCINAAGSFTIVDAQTCNSSANQRWKFSGVTPLNLGGGTSTGSTGTITNSSTVPAGYHLTFDDEFQSLSISDTNGAGTKWYTHTIQCCMSDTSNPSTPTYMAGINDGAGKNPYSLIPGQGLDIRLQKTNGAWYSGVLATVDGKGAGFSQKYGYFEMRAKFPAGLGTWPAFWFMNPSHLSQGVPAGELDFVEAYMFAPTLINTTLHDWGTGTQLAYHQSQVANMATAFHTYGMLWTASNITFYFDGAVIWQTATPSIMNQPYYPIIDLGLGGGWPTDQTPQQSDMIVQYMRVYSN
ncbi:family 16 glycosylhydrolase [Granulicella sp. WH15]|uniref:ricin-type beta-trefoil lectin domain protein n=1 Tax=Granulicella sp. WH15 TaxID=2602070 RepID=UPI0013671688|nr:ricin-type beta-trefoil lectin domain protein [Granulicella sp. WH15]QHN04024.1 family 16 glycosylhydrolase [Granulicella sp. WH15]